MPIVELEEQAVAGTTPHCLRCGFCADPDYPSGALFEKSVNDMSVPSFPQFVEVTGQPDTAQETRQLAGATR